MRWSEDVHRYVERDDVNSKEMERTTEDRGG